MWGIGGIKMHMRNRIALIFSTLWMLSGYVGYSAIPQVATNGAKLVCEEVPLHQDLILFKQPDVFLPNLAEIYADPAIGFERLMEESPIYTILSGTIHIQKLKKNPIAPFKDFGAISKLYATVDPRLKYRPVKPHGAGEVEKHKSKPTLIMPVRMCGDNLDNGNLGFVIYEDFQAARAELGMDGKPQSLPPSVYPNPIPKLNLRKN